MNRLFNRKDYDGNKYQVPNELLTEFDEFYDVISTTNPLSARGLTAQSKFSELFNQYIVKPNRSEDFSTGMPTNYIVPEHMLGMFDELTAQLTIFTSNDTNKWYTLFDAFYNTFNQYTI